MNNKTKACCEFEYDSILYGNTSKGITNKYSMTQPEQDSLTGR